MQTDISNSMGVTCVIRGLPKGPTMFFGDLSRYNERLCKIVGVDPSKSDFFPVLFIDQQGEPLNDPTADDLFKKDYLFPVNTEPMEVIKYILNDWECQFEIVAAVPSSDWVYVQSDYIPPSQKRGGFWVMRAQLQKVAYLSDDEGGELNSLQDPHP